MIYLLNHRVADILGFFSWHYFFFFLSLLFSLEPKCCRDSFLGIALLSYTSVLLGSRVGPTFFFLHYYSCSHTSIILRSNATCGQHFWQYCFPTLFLWSTVRTALCYGPFLFSCILYQKNWKMHCFKPWRSLRLTLFGLSDSPVSSAASAWR